MNTMAMNTVYNHFLTSYAPKSTCAYDTHKKSELRSIYNSIVKLNKESPLYLVDVTKDTQAFAVNIKEGARALRNTIASLGGMNESELLNKKVAYSSNNDLVEASFISDSPDTEHVPSLDIKIDSLASPQVNTGHFLSSSSMDLEPDTYSFDLNINDLNYEFQFNVNPEDTNKDLQERLARLISNADVGIQASVLDDAQGNTSLRLVSAATGLKDGAGTLFSISDDKTSKSNGVVDYLGIADVSRPASNAIFSINGIENEMASNHFTVEKTYELTLKGISGEGDAPVTISLKNDTESIQENVNHLIGSYNDFIRAASEHLTSQSRNSTLLSEMGRISNHYRTDFENMGLNLQEDGTISVDSKLFEEAANREDVKETFSVMRNFTNSLLRKSDTISLNPMEYVDKTIVAYKNPGKSFSNPYVTSAYSGMMFNSYC